MSSLRIDQPIRNEQAVWPITLFTSGPEHLILRIQKAVRVNKKSLSKPPCLFLTFYSSRPRVKLFLRGEIRYT